MFVAQLPLNIQYFRCQWRYKIHIFGPNSHSQVQFWEISHAISLSIHLALYLKIVPNPANSKRQTIFQNPIVCEVPSRRLIPWELTEKQCHPSVGIFNPEFFANLVWPHSLSPSGVHQELHTPTKRTLCYSSDLQAQIQYSRRLLKSNFKCKNGILRRVACQFPTLRGDGVRSCQSLCISVWGKVLMCKMINDLVRGSSTRTDKVHSTLPCNQGTSGSTRSSNLFSEELSKTWDRGFVCARPCKAFRRLLALQEDFEATPEHLAVEACRMSDSSHAWLSSAEVVRHMELAQ